MIILHLPLLLFLFVFCYYIYNIIIHFCQYFLFLFSHFTVLVSVGCKVATPFECEEKGEPKWIQT